MWASSPTTESGKFPFFAVGGDAHIAPPFDRNTSSDHRRGRRPRRPAVGEQSPTFRSMSGSDAGGETILHFGTVLPKPCLPTGKEDTPSCQPIPDHFVAANRDTSSKPPRFIRHRRRFGDFQETLVSCALLGTFPAREKCPAGGMDKPIQPPNPNRNKNPEDGTPVLRFCFVSAFKNQSSRSARAGHTAQTSHGGTSPRRALRPSSRSGCRRSA